MKTSRASQPLRSPPGRCIVSAIPDGGVPMSRHAVRGLLVACAVIALIVAAAAQTVTEFSSETRFQLDLHVPDAALNAYLPQGWMPNVAAQGPAKDANL